LRAPFTEQSPPEIKVITLLLVKQTSAHQASLV